MLLCYQMRRARLAREVPLVKLQVAVAVTRGACHGTCGGTLQAQHAARLLRTRPHGLEAWIGRARTPEAGDTTHTVVLF